MTNQQMQYAYWQRMRQLQTYRAYVAGSTSDKKNSYDKIAKVSDNYFLNYLEYDAKNIDSKNAADYLKAHEDPSFAVGRCSGAFDRDSGIALRQLDWYYNNESEFIVKIKADPSKGIYGSIGVTAASPKMTKDIAKHYITTGQYYDYFDVLPFFTVDGVNENGIYAQSNVVMKNGVEIDIKKEDVDNLEECCIVMLVRYILDHFTKEDIVSTTAVYNNLYNNVHIYGTSKLGGYNSHVMVSHFDPINEIYNKSYVIEFTDKKDGIVVNEFPIMTNFRTFRFSGSGELQPIPTTSSKHITPPYWGEIEQNGIGIERWNAAADFLEEYSGSSVDEFKNLRQTLDYVHAYDRPFESYTTWLTDNLSGDLTVEDMKDYHENPSTALSAALIEEALDGYRDQFDNRSRNTGNTWITTHSAIYDTVNLSCNIRSQMSTAEETCWNVTFDGHITEDMT